MLVTNSMASLCEHLMTRANVVITCVREVCCYRTLYRCPRRNVPDSGRVFLMLKHADITQNTYVQS
jgi:hypothetical protein